MRACNLPEEIMDNSKFSIALTGVVPAACDAEAGEVERQSFPQDHVVHRLGTDPAGSEEGRGDPAVPTGSAIA
jgi:hypothetical protein